MGRRVLVVDDHSMSLELVTELLEQEGNQVLAAASGEIGLRLAQLPTWAAMDPVVSGSYLVIQ